MENRVQYPYQKYVFSERRTSFGDLYPDKTFFLLRLRWATSSMGALMCAILRYLFDMEEKYGKDTIPVFDFSCGWSPYVKHEELGIVNWWEYFFDQPTIYSVNMIYNAKNVILNNAATFDAGMKWFDGVIDNPIQRRRVYELFDKYIVLNGRIRRKADALQKELFKNAERILGWSYRGTDYRNQPVIGEHKHPSLEEELTLVEEKMKEWNMDHLFLSTEDLPALEIAKNRFGNKLIYSDRERYQEGVHKTPYINFNRDNDNYRKGEDYLLDMCLLSRCNAFCAGRHGLVQVVLPMSQGHFEHEHIWDLGFYTRDDYVFGSFLP